MATPNTPQNFSNHTRFDPVFHFAVPILALTLVATVVRAVRNPTPWNLWMIAFVLVVAILAVRLRQYALKVQDRLIRLEERLRLASLSPALHSRIPDLSEKQLIALRFASDGEAPALAQKALDEKLSAKLIKQQIRAWRPDYWRV